MLYLAVNQVLGNVIEPRMQGIGLGLSPLIVLVSLLFWGWVLGPVGALLSAPLTATVKIIVEGFEETRWIAVLMGEKPEPPPTEAPKKMPRRPVRAARR
jgi:predicted PurR-regulated permease PerM